VAVFATKSWKATNCCEFDWAFPRPLNTIRTKSTLKMMDCLAALTTGLVAFAVFIVTSS
jgi:hypothetical protein